jgi:hypothetical protein
MSKGRSRSCHTNPTWKQRSEWLQVCLPVWAERECERYCFIQADMHACAVWRWCTVFAVLDTLDACETLVSKPYFLSFAIGCSEISSELRCVDYPTTSKYSRVWDISWACESMLDGPVYPKFSDEDVWIFTSPTADKFLISWVTATSQLWRHFQVRGANNSLQSNQQPLGTDAILKRAWNSGACCSSIGNRAWFSFRYCSASWVSRQKGSFWLGLLTCDWYPWLLRARHVLWLSAVPQASLFHRIRCLYVLRIWVHMHVGPWHMHGLHGCMDVWMNKQFM